jgi:hypothetical protein
MRRQRRRLDDFDLFGAFICPADWLLPACGVILTSPRINKPIVVTPNVPNKAQPMATCPIDAQ